VAVNRSGVGLKYRYNCHKYAHAHRARQRAQVRNCDLPFALPGRTLVANRQLDAGWSLVMTRRRFLLLVVGGLAASGKNLKAFHFTTSSTL
jgi:hypothetical protein